MASVDFLGVIAAVLVNVSFIPQFIKSWKTKKTGDISLVMYVVYTAGILLWLIYGSIIKNIPIILSNGVGLILILSVLYLKIRYG